MPQNNLTNKNRYAQRWEKFKKLPPNLQDAIFDPEIADKIQSVASKFNLETEQLESMAEITGEAILGEIIPSNFPKQIAQRLKIDEPLSVALAFELNRQILSNLLPSFRSFLQKLPPEALSAYQQATRKAATGSLPALPAKEKMDIRTALGKKPQIGLQTIGQNKIRLTKEGVEVNPTIKNWLQDYDEFLGVQWHSNLDRLRYLQESPNARKLSPQERNSLGKIFKSYDEKTPLLFDETTSAFTLTEERPALPSPPSPTPSSSPILSKSKVPLTHIVDLKQTPSPNAENSLLVSHKRNTISPRKHPEPLDETIYNMPEDRQALRNLSRRK